MSFSEPSLIQSKSVSQVKAPKSSALQAQNVSTPDLTCSKATGTYQSMTIFSLKF